MSNYCEEEIQVMLMGEKLNWETKIKNKWIRLKFPGGDLQIRCLEDGRLELHTSLTVSKKLLISPQAANSIILEFDPL